MNEEQIKKLLDNQEIQSNNLSIIKKCLRYFSVLSFIVVLFSVINNKEVWAEFSYNPILGAFFIFGTLGLLIWVIYLLSIKK